MTEVSLGGLGTSIHVPWMAGWGPVYFGGFGPIARLIGTTFRFVLLVLVACLALVVARRAVEGSAQRVTDDPIRATLVGLVAWVLFVPMLVLIAVVLAISIIGIPLLLLIPFAVIALIVMAIVGFSGTASAIGQWARRRFGLSTTSGFADVCLGILIILLPLLIGRVIGLGRLDAQPDRVSLRGDGPGGRVPRMVRRVRRRPHECRSRDGRRNAAMRPASPAPSATPGPV